MIEAGQYFPDVELFVTKNGGPDSITSQKLLGNAHIALFGLPGAFTRTCSAKHFPGFLEHRDAFLAKGIDRIICLSTNDVFVLNAWGDKFDNDQKIMLVSDGNLNFTRAAGLEADMSANGFGPRCRRFSMLINNGVITHIHLEAPGEFGETSAETLLRDLPS